MIKTPSCSSHPVHTLKIKQNTRTDLCLRYDFNLCLFSITHMIDLTLLPTLMEKPLPYIHPGEFFPLKILLKSFFIITGSLHLIQRSDCFVFINMVCNRNIKQSQRIPKTLSCIPSNEVSLFSAAPYEKIGIFLLIKLTN